MAGADTHFASCDWGTSSFRLRLVAAEGLTVPAEIRSERGCRTFAELPVEERADAYAGYLRTQLDELAQLAGIEIRGLTTVISGMAGSSIGWRELPYAPLPCPVDGSRLVMAQLWSEEPVHLVSGVRAELDVMRGEETEMVGLFALPEWQDLADGTVIVMPGTHCKHVVVEGKAIVGFRTFMTGELLDILTCYSMLQHSVDPEAPLRETNLAEGLEAAKDQPLTHLLFQIRAGDVLKQRKSDEAYSFLLGIILGQEMQSLQRMPAAQPLVLSGGSRQSATYETALRLAGFGEHLRVVPGNQADLLAVAGHRRLWQRITDGGSEHDI